MHFSGTSSRQKVSLRGKSKAEESREQVLERTRVEREKRKRAKQEHTNAIVIQVRAIAGGCSWSGRLCAAVGGCHRLAPRDQQLQRAAPDLKQRVAAAVLLEVVVVEARTPAGSAAAVGPQRRVHPAAGPVSAASCHERARPLDCSVPPSTHAVHGGQLALCCTAHTCPALRARSVLVPRSSALLPGNAYIRPFLQFVDPAREDDVRTLSLVCGRLLATSASSAGERQAQQRHACAAARPAASQVVPAARARRRGLLAASGRHLAGAATRHCI